ncbi:hypothetical protein [Streptomyces violascens]|uniref:hypothetical protein n=1 Tax=Streptomyces violascens TaxID=67381 RepID=UPI003657AEBC
MPVRQQGPHPDETYGGIRSPDGEAWASVMRRTPFPRTTASSPRHPTLAAPHHVQLSFSVAERGMFRTPSRVSGWP